MKETIGQDSKKDCAREKSGASKGFCAFERSVWRLLPESKWYLGKGKGRTQQPGLFFTFSSGYH